MSPALDFERVACERGGRLLFERLDLSLGAGDAAIVTGPNGVGKSSLLRIAAGLLASAAGAVTRSGTIALAAADAAALDPALPLARALGFWARLDRRSADDVQASLETMGIAHLADVPVRMLSTGQRRRAALVRVIAGRADIWLLDEPGNGVDTSGLARLADAVAAHRAHVGIVLAATHQPIGIHDAREVALAT